MTEFSAVRLRLLLPNRIGMARQAMAAVQWILLDMHKTMTGKIAEATALNRRLTAIKTGFRKEIMDAALHKNVLATIFGDRFDEHLGCVSDIPRI